MKTKIKNVVVSEKPHKGEQRVGRPGMHTVDGIHEIVSLCRDSDGGLCRRSFGLFEDLDNVPDWFWNA